MRKVVTREKPDVAGKAVDEIVCPDQSFMMCFDADRRGSLEKIQLGVLDAMKRLAESANRRTRSRDFVVLFGRMRNRIGISLYCICLPPNISARVTTPFFEVTRALGCVDAGTYPLADLSLEPLARYMHGTVIVYTGPSSPYGWLPPKFKSIKSWNLAWETRCADLISHRSFRSGRITYHPIPKALLPQKPARERHTLNDHIRLSEALNSILVPAPSSGSDALPRVPFGYRRLRDLCTKHMGISVIEESLPGSCSAQLRIGGTHVDETGLSARVTVRINRLLPAETKFLALAHELAHYRLHFPWLLAFSLIFDEALRVPEIVVVWKNFLKTTTDVRGQLEQEADLYSSYFILPAIADNLEALADHMLLAGEQPTAEELAWHLLSPFFPADSVDSPSWKEYRGQTRRANDALLKIAAGLPQASLMERYFFALVERLRSVREYRFESTSWAARLLTLITTVLAEDGDVRKNVQRLVDARVRSEGWHRPASQQEFLNWFAELAQAYVGLETESSLEVVPPRNEADSSPVCQVSVLVSGMREPDGSLRTLTALPGMSVELPASCEAWSALLPTHGFLIADIPDSLVEILKRDASDVPCLVIRPAPWNLQMRRDGDWHAAGILQGDGWVETHERAMAGSFEDWMSLCVQNGLRLQPWRLSEVQRRELERFNLVDPYLVSEILKRARSLGEIDLMIERAKSALSLDMLPWEREDYFESDRRELEHQLAAEEPSESHVPGAQRCAERILQDCTFGGLFQGDFWRMMFQAKGILERHNIPSGVQLEALEAIRKSIVDVEVCGDFERWFQCEECQRSFMPALRREYVEATLRAGATLCSECSPMCEELRKGESD